MESRRQISERRALACPGCGCVVMDRTAVASSNIASVGWEQDEGGDGILEVEFNSGQVYQYTGVPQWVYQGLLFSPSPGRYLRESIVEAYEGQRIE